MSGTASGWTPVGPAGGGRWELLVFCCIWLGLRARCAGIGTGKESGRMVFTDVDWPMCTVILKMADKLTSFPRIATRMRSVMSGFFPVIFRSRVVCCLRFMIM